MQILIPSTVAADYTVFAQRCSKCHALSRSVTTSIHDDAHWAAVVARMQRQPGSGINDDDAAAVRRFLHYYSNR